MWWRPTARGCRERGADKEGNGKGRRLVRVCRWSEEDELGCGGPRQRRKRSAMEEKQS